MVSRWILGFQILLSFRVGHVIGIAFGVATWWLLWGTDGTGMNGRERRRRFRSSPYGRNFLLLLKLFIVLLLAIRLHDEVIHWLPAVVSNVANTEITTDPTMTASRTTWFRSCVHSSVTVPNISEEVVLQQWTRGWLEARGFRIMGTPLERSCIVGRAHSRLLALEEEIEVCQHHHGHHDQYHRRQNGSGNAKHTLDLDICGTMLFTGSLSSLHQRRQELEAFFRDQLEHLILRKRS